MSEAKNEQSLSESRQVSAIVLITVTGL